jgi:predicted RNase H-like HicB family nuclease
MDRTYTVVLLKEEDGGYYVIVPALPGCVTQGGTVEQCLERAREAIQSYLKALEIEDDPVPEETGIVSFEMGEAQEARVHRVRVPELQEAAQAA